MPALTGRRHDLPRRSFLLLALAVSLSAADALAQTRFNFTPFGPENSFETATNWNPLGPPGVIDTADFNAPATYSVLFNSSPTNNTLFVPAGDVTFRPLLGFQGIEHTYAYTFTSFIQGRLTLEGNGNETFRLNGTFFNLSGGALNILPGASATMTRSATIGAGMGLPSSEALVDGGSWTTPGIVVGDRSDGSLTIENGGAVSSSGPALIADTGGVHGEVSVGGPSSMWASAGALQVGTFGHGTLSITDGGSVASGESSIGRFFGSTGAVMVQGAGSNWTTSSNLFVGGTSLGRGGLGSLTIGPGGSVDVAGDTVVHADSVVELKGGTFSTGSIGLLGGEFDFDSGTLNITGPQGVTVGPTGLFGPSLALDDDESLIVDNTLTIDPGATLFSDSDLRAGALQNNGDLIALSATVDGPVNSPAGSTITVLGDVTFSDLVSGAGGFFGPGTAIFSGGHNPGDSPAVVPVEGNLAYGGTNTLTIELEGLLAGQFDRLEVQGDVFLDGALAVELLSGFAPSLGDTFEILNVGGALTGEFSGVGEGALFAATGGQQFLITYAGGDGNDVVLTAVPEPSSMVLLLLAWSPMIGVSRKSRISRLRA